MVLCYAVCEDFDCKKQEVLALRKMVFLGIWLTRSFQLVIAGLKRQISFVFVGLMVASYFGLHNGKNDLPDNGFSFGQKNEFILIILG